MTAEQTETPVKDSAAECVDAKTKGNQIRDDLLWIESLLEGTEVYLTEALHTLTFPEVYGLEDPERRGKALKKLQNEIETVQDYINDARGRAEYLRFRLE
jgi:hypothetical protein